MTANVSFPFGVAATGRVVLAERDAYVRQLIELTLFTIPGERVDRPDFGCGVQRLVFASPGAETASIAALVRGGLQQGIGGEVQVRSVDISTAESTLQIVVGFIDSTTGRAGEAFLERRL